MNLDPELLDQIPLPRELLEQTPEPVLVFLMQLLAENQLLRARIVQLEAENQALLARIERLEARLNQDSSNSNKPPSSDSPFKPKDKEAFTPKPKTRRRRKGVRQQCLRPTEVTESFPPPCPCGCNTLIDVDGYYIHQIIELPVITPIVEHNILHRGRCIRCGRINRAVIPPEKRAGFGPRFSALVAELCGVHGDSRRAAQDFVFSVLGVPVSQGGIEKILQRASAAIEPHYDAIAQVVRSAPVNHADETSWRLRHRLAWLWVLACANAALFLVHGKRSKAAFVELIKDWTGVLVSDGYGVYRKWAGQRQTCLAHLIREAEGLSERSNAELARCGSWGLKELQRLCHMAKAPPTVGQWNMFYARLIRFVAIYGVRQDDAGRFARRLQREMEHLWLFLKVEGVAPTNNHAERLLRFAVIWRRRSLGAQSEHGCRWVERILSLRQTCRLRGQRTFNVLVDALDAYFRGEKPDLAWIAGAAA